MMPVSVQEAGFVTSSVQESMMVPVSVQETGCVASSVQEAGRVPGSDLVSGGAGMWPGFFSEIQLRFFSSDCSAKRGA